MVDILWYSCSTRTGRRAQRENLFTHPVFVLFTCNLHMLLVLSTFDFPDWGCPSINTITELLYEFPTGKNAIDC